MNRVLNKTFELIKNNFVITLILFFGFIIRWYGIYFDYPYVANLVWDEIQNITNVLRIFEQKSLLASSSTYPVLMTFLYMPTVVMRIIYIGIREGLYSVGEIRDYVLSNGMGQIYIIVRWYSVFMGTGLILITYKIYRIIFREKIYSYYGAFIITTNVILVFLSHWGKLHMPMLFFLLLSLYCVILFERSKNIKHFYYSIFFSALSLSSHYFGLSAFIFPLLGFLFNRKKFNFFIIVKSALLYIFLNTFFYLLAGQKLLSDVLSILNKNYSSSNYVNYFPVGKLEKFYYIFRDIFEISPVFIVVFAIFFMFNFRKYIKNKYAGYIIWGIIFNYALMVTVFSAPERARHLSAFILLSFPLAGAYLIDFLKKIKLSKKFIYFILILFTVPSLVISIRWLYILNGSTAEDLVVWLNNNLNKNEIAYSLERTSFNANYSYNAALWQKEKNNIQTNQLNYILNHKDIYESKGINLYYDENNKRYNTLAGANTKYVIIQFWQTGEQNVIYKNTTRKKVYRMIDEVRKYHNIELVKKFYPTFNDIIIENDEMDYIGNPLYWWNLFKIKKSGTYIEVYKLI